MTTLSWDELGERIYETGIDKGVLYIPDETGDYDSAVAWNGIVSVSESNSGGTPVTVYADNRKYISLSSDADFSATLQAYTYPDEFAPFDGLLVPTKGLIIGQQSTVSFGLSYRSLIGNALEGHSPEVGYKLHLVWNATATPSEKVYSTISDASNPVLFSWKLDTVPIPIAIGKPTAHIAIVSNKVDSAKLLSFEQIIYGDVDTPPRLPTPNEVIEHFMGPSEPELELVYVYYPTLNDTTGDVTIPTAYGVAYRVGGIIVTGVINIDRGETLVVVATPTEGFRIAGDIQSQTFNILRNTAEVTPVQPTLDLDTNVITIPSIGGLVYSIDGTPVTGVYNLSYYETVVIDLNPDTGYTFTTIEQTFTYTYEDVLYAIPVASPTYPYRLFETNDYNINADANIVWEVNGLVTSAGVYTIPVDETVTIRAVPDTGYRLSVPPWDTTTYVYSYTYNALWA